MLGQPVMQLDAGAARHAEVGHDHLIPAMAGAPQLSYCDAAVFRFVRFPTPAPKIARQRRTDGPFVVNDEGPPLAFGSRTCDRSRVG